MSMFNNPYSRNQSGGVVSAGPGSAPGNPNDFASWANGNIPGGFDAWKQRQFSSDPFSQDEVSKGWATQPGGALPGGFGGGGGSGSKPWMNPSSWDPRSITGRAPFQKLMGFANQGSGAAGQARQDVAPALQFMQSALATKDPLGTAGTKTLIEQRGLGALRDAGSAARGRLDDTFGGVNAAASPEGMELARALTRQNEAAGIGSVNQAAQEAGIQERAATGAFQAGVSQSLGNLGLGLGGLGQNEFGQQLQAATAAGGLEASANNTWADIMGSLLRTSMQPWQPARPIAPGQTEPYPYPGAPGTFTGGQNADPFALLNAMFNAQNGSGPDAFRGGAPSNHWQPDPTGAY
jgi:hypothetical protein